MERKATGVDRNLHVDNEPIKSLLIFSFPVSEGVRLLQVSNSALHSTNKAVVSWRKPDGGDDINQYYIEWYQDGSNQRSGERYVKHVSKKVNYTIAIANLQSATSYKVLVCVNNAAGNGSYQTAYVTTGSYELVQVS